MVNKGKNIFKVGVSKNMKKRLQAYSTGKEIHPDIKFIMAINDKKAVEKCVKSFGENSKYIIGKELYKIDYDLLKDLVFSCGKIDKKFSKNICKNSDSYVVFDDTKAKLYLDPYSKIINNKKNAKKNK